MKVLYMYKPMNSSDSSVTVTGSSAQANFPISNLKSFEPSKAFKTVDASGSKFVKYDAGYGQKFNVNALFLNRFNFAQFYIQGSDDDFASTPFSLHVTGCVRDEFFDENTAQLQCDNYMSYWCSLTAFNYRYLRLYIPAQTPIFETSYFKVGNMLIGTEVEIWNPKPGFSVTPIYNESVVEFESGYDSFSKKGKAYRIFEGEFDKITLTESQKIKMTKNPFAIYFDWTGNPQECYLVRNIREFKKVYDMFNVLTRPFAMKEVV